MKDRAATLPALLRSSMPVWVLAVMVIALLALPLYSDNAATTFNVYNSLQSFASVGLLALAVGLSMLAGEFDLSTIGMYGLGGMLAVKFGVESPVLGVLVAIGAGVLVGLLQGTIIARLGISSVPVTLGGYIALLGLTNVVSGGDSVAYDNLGAGVWLEQQIGQFFSPRSLIAIGAFLFVAALLYWTRIGRDLRAVGGDRRSARAAGVRTDLVLVLTFVASASIAALGGALLSYSIASAKPDPGTLPLVFAVTAVLLGGVTLAGGRGPILGIAAGAISLSLLQELFAIQATPAYVSQLVLGGLLVLVVAFDSPDLKKRLVAARARMKDRGTGPAPGAGIGEAGVGERAVP